MLLPLQTFFPRPRLKMFVSATAEFRRLPPRRRWLALWASKRILSQAESLTELYVLFSAVALPSRGCSRGSWMGVVFPTHPAYSCSSLVLTPRFPSQGNLYGRDCHHTIHGGGGAVYSLPIVAVRKGVPHTYVDLPSPLVLIEAAEMCIPNGNKEILLAAVYKPPGRAWSDADVTGLLNLRNKSRLAGDLNAKNPVWNSRVSNLSGMGLLDLQENNDFQILAHSVPPIIVRKETVTCSILFLGDSIMYV
jgi:hypothetical protein